MGLCSCRDLGDFPVVLILILCATIPFLIGFVIFHSLAAGGLWYDSTIRDNDCFANYSNESVQELFDKYERIHDVCPLYLIDRRVAMIGSLHRISKKTNPPTTSTFVCPVTFFDRGLAFASKKCLTNRANISEYFIRMGSSFADQGGTVHKVLGVFHVNRIRHTYTSDLILLDYYHNIPMDCEFKSLAVTFFYLNTSFIKQKLVTKVSVFQFETNKNGQLQLQHYVAKLYDIHTRECQKVMRDQRKDKVRYNRWMCVNFEEPSPSCIGGSLMFLNTVYFLGANMDDLRCTSMPAGSFVLYEKVFFFYWKVLSFLTGDFLFRTTTTTPAPTPTKDFFTNMIDKLMDGVDNIGQVIVETIREVVVNTINIVTNG